MQALIIALAWTQIQEGHVAVNNKSFINLQLRDCVWFALGKTLTTANAGCLPNN